jgi:hypothetical protein
MSAIAQKTLLDVIDSTTFVGATWEWEWEPGRVCYVRTDGFHSRGQRPGYTVELYCHISWLTVQDLFRDRPTEDLRRAAEYAKQFLPPEEVLRLSKVDEEDFVRYVSEGTLRLIKSGPQRPF